MEKTEQRKSLFISCSPKVSYLQVLDAARPSIWREQQRLADRRNEHLARREELTLLTFNHLQLPSLCIIFIDFH